MLELLYKTMEKPATFGAFHLCFMALTILFTIFLVKKFNNCSDKKYRRIILILWITIIVLEIIKQIVKNYDITTATWQPYDYSAFPFQFCSLPYYVLPFIVFLKDCKVRDLLINFTATFAFVGGFLYFFVPTAFCEYVYINIHTMVHHGILVGSGVLTFVHEYKKINYKDVAISSIFLVIAVLISIPLNVGFYNLSTHPEEVNLMELSPVNRTTSPVLKDILNATNYVIYLLVYLTFFTLYSLFFYFAMKYIRKWIISIREKKAEKEASKATDKANNEV